MESGKILDKQITASSEWDANHTAHQGRLNFQEVVEGVVAKKSGSWYTGNAGRKLHQATDIWKLGERLK